MWSKRPLLRGQVVPATSPIRRVRLLRRRRVHRRPPHTLP
jgi:hypothetical protein